MDGLSDVRHVDVDTPFGPSSDSIAIGSLDGVTAAFLPRHGRGHRLSPTEIPARANIYALKTLGVERIVSVSAVGSLRDHIRPLDMLIPDQIIDRTRNRTSTFYENGIVAHIAFSDPFCPEISSVLAGAAGKQATTHVGGTCVVIEGPQFSTRAESELYRSFGADIIGMTALPEAKLAREAEMCYATLALITDFDTWHQTEDDVSVDLVIANLRRNVASSRLVMREVVSGLPTERSCTCSHALESAIITDPEYIGSEARERLAAIIGKRVPKADAAADIPVDRR
ncbi:MAG: S-methyl-5'-thioadenosine phosphorylase [SAR202 cluster bacterium]|nr:S-methyl-5'-thioadenosine phosphorylase [SAR202 cluster bacterium]